MLSRLPSGHVSRCQRNLHASCLNTLFGRARSASFGAKSVVELAQLIGDVGGIALRNGPQGMIRVAEVAQSSAVVSSSLAADWLNAVAVSAGQPSPPTPQTAAALRKLFERLGATYVKLGQFIASAPSIFPEEYVIEFQKCLDAAPAVPFPEIVQAIEADLGKPLHEIFEFVDNVPLAAASVAQVHAAKLHGGKNVVVKVLRPGIENVLATDLDFVYSAARLLEFLQPSLSHASLVALATDIRTSMLEEVDLRKEAKNVEAFRQYIFSSGVHGVFAPYIYHEASGKRTLTMERVFGSAVTDLESVKAACGGNPKVMIENVLNAWAGSVIACESFHADVHAGNLLVTTDGRVAFVDFGIVGRVRPETWDAVRNLLHGLSFADFMAVAQSLAEIGAADGPAEGVDLEAFAYDLKKLAEHLASVEPTLTVEAASPGQMSASLAVDETQVTRLALDIVRLGETYGLRFPREFGLLLKQVLYFDRYLRLLAPSLSMQDIHGFRIDAPPAGTGDRRVNPLGVEVTNH